MRKLTPFVACLLLVLTAWTGTAHASGMSSCDEPMQTEVAAHFDGDCDQVPMDTGKSYPHHHNACHGCQAAFPIQAAADVPLTADLAVPTIASVVGLTAADVETALRPPQA